MTTAVIDSRGVILTTLDDDLDSRDSVDDCQIRSSAVMPIAMAHPAFASVVDELVVRLHSLTQQVHRRSISGYAVGTSVELMWESALYESREWWIDHGLAELNSEQRRWLTKEILRRASPEATLLSIAAFAPDRLWNLDRNDVEKMRSWYGAMEEKYRAIGYALALRVLAPWFDDESSDYVDRELPRWTSGGSVELASATLVLGIGLMQQSPVRHIDCVWRLVSDLQNRTDLVQIGRHVALGWLLSRLWLERPDRVECWLIKNCGAMSRKVIRLAVARVPSDRRQKLIGAWKTSRTLR